MIPTSYKENSLGSFACVNEKKKAVRRNTENNFVAVIDDDVPGKREIKNCARVRGREKSFPVPEFPISGSAWVMAAEGRVS
jgi:hypothetical protein